MVSKTGEHKPLKTAVSANHLHVHDKRCMLKGSLDYQDNDGIMSLPLMHADPAAGAADVRYYEDRS